LFLFGFCPFALSSIVYKKEFAFFGSRDKKPSKDETLISNIMFYSRGGFFNDGLKGVTSEWFEAQIKKVIK
jgi:hypothetical protein